MRSCSLSLSLPSLAGAVFLLSAPSAFAAFELWNGGGTTDNWSDPGNWSASTLDSGDSPLFTGSTRLTNINDTTADTLYDGITFAIGAGAFTLGGNRITLINDINNSGTTATLQTINLDLVLNGNRQFNLNSVSSLQVNGIISETGGPRNLVINNTASDTGTAILAGANTYTGTTSINGGTLLMGAANTLANSSGIILDGGKLGSGGLTGSTGILTLVSSSVIDMGAGTSHMTFSSPSAAAWSGVLSVWNWTGSTAGGGTDQVLFTSGTGNLDSAELANIQFYSDGGITAFPAGATFVGNELVPVPEPGAVMGALVLVGVIGWRERRTWLHYRPATR